MLYLYNGRIFVKPFENKIVEVQIKKDLDGVFNVIPTKNVIVDDNLKDKISLISIDKAYELTHRRKKED